MGIVMNIKAVDFQTMYPREAEEECVWKIVMNNNLSGEGTSFDPSNLTHSACRCITCDGYECDCLSYAV